MEKLVEEIAKEICRGRMFTYLVDPVTGCPDPTQPLPLSSFSLEHQRDTIDHMWGKTDQTSLNQVAAYTLDAHLVIGMLQTKGLLKPND